MGKKRWQETSVEGQIMILLLYCVGLIVVVYFWGPYFIRDVISGIIFIVVVVVGLYMAVELNSLPKKLRARKQLAHLTGRTEGRITSHYEERIDVRDENGNWKSDPNGTVIFYEFEVGGQTYTGKGYGSWARGKREQQTICYDPNNPSDNLPLHDLDRRTKTNFIGTFLYVIISFALFFGVIMLFAWIMR